MDFRHARRNRRLHAWMIALLLTSLALGLNYLAFMIKLGVDLTREDRYTLSQETLAWLEKLERPADVIITIRESSNSPKIIQRLLLDLGLLLDAFERAPSSFPIRIHRVDVNARKAHNKLIEKYSLADPNLIVVASGGKDEGGKTIVFRFEDQPSSAPSDPEQAFRSRESKARDAVFDSGLYTDWEDGPRNVPEPTKFVGEKVILQGILRVARNRNGPDVIYFSRGHGESSPSDMSRERGYSEAQAFLESRNLRVALLEPDPNARIPEDAALVVVTSPQVPFREQEVARLRTYLSERNGNLLLLLDPVSNLSPDSPPAFGFRPLLKEWGLRCHDMLVHDPDPSKFDIFTGDYALRTYSRRDAHPVVAPLMKDGLPIYTGACRPVEREPIPPEQVEATELVYSSRLSWGVSNWTSRKPPYEQNDLLDLPGPVPVAVVAEKKLRPRHAVNVRGGKVAAIGSSRLFGNRILRANAGNRNLLRNLLHWFLDEEDMLDVPPSPVVRYAVNMSEEQFGNLLYSMTAVPGCIALLGLFVHWLRKDA